MCSPLFYRRSQQFEPKSSTPIPTEPRKSLPRSSKLSSSSDLSHSLRSPRDENLSLTEFPHDSNEKIRTRSSSNSAVKNMGSVKRALITSEEFVSASDISEIAEIQDSLLDDLGETKEVLAQLQNLVRIILSSYVSIYCLNCFDSLQFFKGKLLLLRKHDEKIYPI